MGIYEGKLYGKGKKFAIIVSRFNNFISERLLEGAIDCFVRHGVEEDDIDIVRVPGSFEIPQTLSWVMKRGKYDGIVCLGVLVRGETPHFDYISAEVTKGIASLALNSDVPVSYGVITADTVDQAIDRGGTKQGNKGWDAAMSVLEMSNLKEEI